MSSALTTRLIDGEAARLELDAAEIRVVAGPDRGARLELGGSSIVIGSGSSCDLVLHDTSVSARHAEISAVSGGYVLRDLSSTNGVLLGAHRVERVVLADRMRLSLGETTLLVKSLGATRTIPLDRPGAFAGLVAHSVRMRAFAAELRALAGSDATVLLEGETGTGKEVAAEALHAASARRHGPFVVFDCAGVNRTLASAQLFGYERGAFTGAVDSHAGAYEEAEGGTLFFDEIGELPLDLQPLLLAGLERRQTRRLGGKAPIDVDVRVVAATNRNLAEEVRAGRFRQDLFYRLAVGRLRLPPLRERLEDLPILAAELARSAGVTLSPELLVPLKTYQWPGNVRELRNMVQRLAISPEDPARWPEAERPTAGAGADRGDTLGPMFEATGELLPLREARRRVVDSFERRYVETVLSHAQGSLSRAAEIAGVTRQSLTELAVKHDLHPRR